MLSCRKLNTTKDDDIRAFEKAQYRAFEGSSIQSLEEIWHIDHTQKRIAPRISYEKLLITVVENTHTLIGAMVMHLDLSGELQLNHFGFDIDRSSPHIAEGLAIFSLAPIINGTVPLFVLRDYTNPLLYAMGLRTLYGTCSKSKLKGYQLLGFTIEQTTIYKGEEKFLLSIPIPKS